MVEINKRVDNVETAVIKNQEKMTCIETETQEIKNSWIKESGVLKKNLSDNNAELERITSKIQSEHSSLQQGIHDLDVQISNLDEEYNLIRAIIDSKKSAFDVTDKGVPNAECETTPIEEDSSSKESTTTASDVIKCRVCEYRFINRKDLTNHMKTSHIKSSKCRQCDKAFFTSSELESHLQEHGSLKKFNCENCGKFFHLKWRFEKHIKMHESGRKIRKCHFYNNDKHCPFSQIGCKFLHEESAKCRYNSQCKVDKCQV